MPLSKLRKLERLPTHEDALRADYLVELTQLSTQPSCAYSFFISQNWYVACARAGSIAISRDATLTMFREGGMEDPHPDNT